MTTHTFKKYLPLLNLLTRKQLSKECYMSLISSLNDKPIKFICECIHNAISLRYISKLHKKKKKRFLNKILPYKKIIKNLCKKRKGFGPCRGLIAQKGYGFIIPILSAIIPLISSLLTSPQK